MVSTFTIKEIPLSETVIVHSAFVDKRGAHIIIKITLTQSGVVNNHRNR